MSDEGARALAVAISCAIRAAGMHWFNVAREQRGETPGYSDESFEGLAQVVDAALNRASEPEESLPPAPANVGWSRE